MTTTMTTPMSNNLRQFVSPEDVVVTYLMQDSGIEMNSITYVPTDEEYQGEFRNDDEHVYK